MPANLTPQYLEAERKYKQAKTVEEKLSALEGMLATIPKHKGTEKLQADIKTRISRLKDQEKKAKGGKREDLYYIKKEGAGQVVIIGSPNAGKSQLLASLTHAKPEVAPFPFTTQKPLAGMMPYENIQIQLIDTPPIAPDFLETGILGNIRNCDLVWLVIDLSSDDPLADLEMVKKGLEEKKIKLYKDEKGLPLQIGEVCKKTMVLGNKNDLENSRDNWEIIKELYSSSFLLYSISAEKKLGLEELKRETFEKLEILRVYTKVPGKPLDYSDPVILKKGQKVLDAAFIIHKDFAHNLKYARIWGKGKYEGQMVHRDQVLTDGDVIEFHL
ncbi:MAG: 50S ribosome-binding GTPase [candidate division Zixibacteria bacterium]|nr:50S ribosome-binding GTPase [candidate division Zixibacteria bacterium]